MDLCVPPYFITTFQDLELSLSYVDSTVSYSYKNVQTISESDLDFTNLNTKVLEYQLPKILFETKDYDSWIKTNVKVSIADIDSSISPYFSISSLTL